MYKYIFCIVILPKKLNETQLKYSEKSQLYLKSVTQNKITQSRFQFPEMPNNIIKRFKVPGGLELSPYMVRWMIFFIRMTATTIFFLW